MSEMTREHLEAVQDEVAVCRAAAKRSDSIVGREVNERQAARLSEVAAMIEAKLESRDEG